MDGFLNHRIDTGLLSRIAEEFGKYFDMDNVSRILTAEASGIALATAVAMHYHKPMIFAKKAKSDNIEGGLYQSDIYSYTYKKKVTLLVSKEWLSSSDKVLIIDDFMANGCLLYTSGEKSTLADMAIRNAQEEVQRATTVEEKTAYTLGVLQKMLHLAQPPKRMESFDISNTARWSLRRSTSRMEA